MYHQCDHQSLCIHLCDHASIHLFIPFIDPFINSLEQRLDGSSLFIKGKSCLDTTNRRDMSDILTENTTYNMIHESYEKVIIVIMMMMMLMIMMMMYNVSIVFTYVRLSDSRFLSLRKTIIIIIIIIMTMMIMMSMMM